MRFSELAQRARTFTAMTAIASIASVGLLASGCDESSPSASIADASKAPATTNNVNPAEENSTEVKTPPAEPAETPEIQEPTVPDNTEGPRIVFEQTFHDFGVISDTLPVSFDFVFHNEGSELLKIGDVKASCGCTAAAPTKNEYLPGEEGSIHVTFKPKGRTGHQAKSIRVESNDPVNRVTNLRISSDIFAAVNVEPKVFRFDQVEAGHAKTITGEVRMRGEGEVTDAEVDGPYASVKVLGSEPIEVSGEPATLTKLEITVGEDAPLGWMDRNVTIRTSNPEVPAVNAPLWANVMGPIEIQPAKLPLGVVRAEVPFRRELRLVSRDGTLFKLKDWKIDCDAEGLQMQIEAAGDEPEEGVAILRLIVTGTGPAQIGKLEGNIVLTTTMDPDRQINVPFHCVVRPAK